MATGGESDIEKGTDETFDFLCSVCRGKNKNTEGDQFCVDCHDYYCSTCVNFHSEIPALKNHKILNKTQFKTSSGGQLPAVLTEMCKEHKHKPVDMYCKQHDTVICSICMINQHSGCNEKFYVPDYIKNNTDIVNSNIVDKLDMIASKLAELQDTFIKDKEKLKRSKEKSLKQIQKYRKEINQMLDELEKKTINDLEQRVQSLTDKTETVLRELQGAINDVLAAKDSLKSASGNKAQMFISIKMADASASRAQEKFDTNKSQVSLAQILFMPHKKLQSVLKEKQTLGVFDLTESLRSKVTEPNCSPHVAKNKTSAISSENRSKHTARTSLVQVTEKQSSKSSPSLLQIKGKKTYTIKMKSDSNKCHIKSACTLADGTFILADYGNSNLKRVNNISYTVTDYCEVPKYPSHLCAITDQDVLACCCGSGLIQFVSVGRSMQKTRKMTSKMFTFEGLAYADEKLFVCDLKSVYVYSLTGDIQQLFCKDLSVQRIFSSIYSLAVSSDNSKIYVADLYKGLIILDKNGQLIGQLNHPELQNAYSVCSYRNDSILVCGSSSNVLQFSLDGKLLGEVLKTDGYCQTVCCNTNNTKLIVTLNYNNIVQVCDISCD